MNFMKYRNFYFLISLLVLIPGIISLFIFGLRPAIDFTGGSLLEFSLSGDDCQRSHAQIKDILVQNWKVESFQNSGECQYILRTTTISQEEKNQLFEELKEQLQSVQELRFETVGPTLGKELLSKTLVAIALVSGVITLYVWQRFKELKFGVCAILAMFHDTLVLLGSFSLLGHFLKVEVDVLFVTALLTTLSFSVHDTIVVYDRIRELSRLHRRKSFFSTVNAAVVQTLARSINNSITIILMLLSLVLLGGDTIKWFAVALLIGAITGTYSSTFTAAPLLLLWDKISEKWQKKN